MLIGRYPALLDANVLHPAFVRSALLWFADERLFLPCWSADILREWQESVRRRFPDATDTMFQRQIDAMSDAFPDAEIDGYEHLIGCLDLADERDRHVLAAAIVGRCSGIVTANVRHFPSEISERYQIEIVHPDDFIVNIIDLDEGRALAACRQHRAAMSASKPNATEYLERYKAAGLIQAHGRLALKVSQL
jgi:predicted nucleic acid-binding protein